jgi:hypothetical protein
MYFVFCRLYLFSPQPPRAVFGSYLSSLLLTDVSPHRRYGLAYPHDGRGFVGPQKKTIVGFLVFNPLCGARYFKGVAGLWIRKYVYTLKRSQIHSHPNSPSIAQLSSPHTVRLRVIKWWFECLKGRLAFAFFFNILLAPLLVSPALLWLSILFLLQY